MRILHPTTIFTILTRTEEDDFKKSTLTRKQVISHAFSECHKYLATRQKHPKMWLNDEELGVYMLFLYKIGCEIGCNFDVVKISKHELVYKSFLYDYNQPTIFIGNKIMMFNGFTDEYLFSDCISLYFKGVNIMKYIYGDEWRRLVPIENLEEILRIINKTLLK